MMWVDRKIIQLVEKIRKCPFLKKYNYILKYTPSIQIEYVEGKGIKIKSISFNNWDEISINDKTITFLPERTNPLHPPAIETLLEYEDWEELYEILGISL